ncbi:MAG: hypothetical protein RLZZ373_3190 [Pseudomonadota bacterium]|jgi:hypothetical protein
MPILHTTDPITYNFAERGRKHRGVDRSIDLRSLTAAINSPATQERIRGGDMLGYFGHWPRRVFGMEPGEGGIVDGVVVSLEPATRTVSLSIDGDGNITHQQAFLDTVDGAKALRTIRAGAGGFSSAISPAGRDTPAKIKQFHGFDCVYEPNYNTNRVAPVLLDSAADGAIDELALLDDVSELAARCDTRMLGTMAAMHVQYQHMREALAFQCQQNDVLVSRLAAAGGRAPALLDSVMAVPGRRDLDALARLQSFKSMPLVPLAEMPEAESSGPRCAEADALAVMQRSRGR